MTDVIGESQEDAYKRAYQAGFADGWRQSREFPATTLEQLTDLSGRMAEVSRSIENDSHLQKLGA